MAELGLTSRGSEDEKEMLIADLLHQEQHLVEAMTKETDRVEELTGQLDRLRKIRQNAVKSWAGNKVNPNFWCQTKHNLEASRRIAEIIENSARLNPDEVPGLVEMARQINAEKEIAKENFLSGDEPVEKCSRCAGDLTITAGPTGKKTAFSTKSLNREMTINDSGDKNMAVDLKEFGGLAVGQAAGVGGSFLAQWAETQFTPTNNVGLTRTRNLVNVGGGLAIGLLLPGLLKASGGMRKTMEVAGSFMFVKGIADAVIEATGTTPFGAVSYRPSYAPVSYSAPAPVMVSSSVAPAALY